MSNRYFKLLSGFIQPLFFTLGIYVGLSQSPQRHSSGGSPLLQNAYNRDSHSLDGDWKYLVDRYETSYYSFFRVPYDSLNPENYGRDPVWLDETPKDKSDRLEYDWDSAASLQVPGDWNSQEESLYFYEGSIYYRTTFNDPRKSPDERLLLYFGGANYRTDVFINGKKIGYHTGGFTPFNFFIGPAVKSRNNSLVVHVSNARDPSGVPMDVTDWWNYGGLTRSVKLLVLPETYVLDYHLQLDPEATGLLSGYVQLDGSGRADKEINIRSNSLDLSIKERSDDAGRINISRPIELSNDQYWSPSSPVLHDFTITSGQDTVMDSIGLRTIRVAGSEILLNGKPVFLRGICAHEENPIAGRRANSRSDARLIMGWAEELHANFLRLAHYPHNEHMPRTADSKGVLLWEEIPVYWVIDWDNPYTLALAKHQLSQLIARDKNRASVIIWSLANETPNIPEKDHFLKALADLAREQDPGRLISAALFKSKINDTLLTVDDPFSKYTDILSFNQYLGWYEGLPAKIDSVAFRFEKEMPVLVSEWGAGALAGFRGDSLTRWSEDYQDYLYRKQLELMDRIPQLSGFTPWILADFRSPRRMHPQFQQGWNRKGVIGQDGTRKLAFYRLQAYYRKLQQAAKSEN